MNDGWIKMWRKVKNSELFLQDPTAWRVFEYLLMSVDYKTGKYTSGRNRDAMFLRIKPTTFYQALLRLSRNWKSIDIKSNNKFSTISILNWHKYQHTDDTSNDIKLTTNRQQNDTNQEVKNIRIKEERELITQDEKEKLLSYLTEKGMNQQLVENELSKFISYWTEKNTAGTKERWQMEKTFEVKKRLTTWFNNINKFERKKDEPRGYRV